MKITTVGGNGFIGGHVVRNLSSNLHQVSVIDVSKNLNPIGNVTYRTCDVFNDTELSNSLKELNPEILISFVGLADAGKCHNDPRLGGPKIDKYKPLYFNFNGIYIWQNTPVTS